MVVMVNQTDAGYAVGMWYGICVFLYCVSATDIIFFGKQRHHTQNQFVNAEIGGDLAPSCKD